MRKTVLITGASGGLGLEFARIYAREGFELVVVARSEGKLYKLKSELETQYDCHVWVLAQDLSQPDAAYEVFNYTLEKNITIDALVNNAGFGDFRQLLGGGRPAADRSPASQHHDAGAAYAVFSARYGGAQTWQCAESIFGRSIQCRAEDVPILCL